MKTSTLWLLLSFVMIVVLSALDDSEIVRKSSVIILIFICVSISRIESLSEKIQERDSEEKLRKPIGRKLKLNIGGNELVGTAGEDLKAGDCVVFGKDGKIRRAKNNV